VNTQVRLENKHKTDLAADQSRCYHRGWRREDSIRCFLNTPYLSMIIQ